MITEHTNEVKSADLGRRTDLDSGRPCALMSLLQDSDSRAISTGRGDFCSFVAARPNQDA